MERRLTMVGVGDHKARGAFFTPPVVADFMARWAVRRSTDRVLEPSCGEAAFLASVGHVLQGMGATATALGVQIVGVDVDVETIGRARAVLDEERLGGALIVSDFFDVNPPGQLGGVGCFDAVVGNPPFIRYQTFTGASRAAGQRTALAGGVTLSRLASSWAATVVHASRFLGPGGRLAMVLPAELLTVNYAESVRTFLRRRFGAVSLVLFERLVFDAALEDVVLLLAEGEGGCDHFDVHHVTEESELSDGLLAAGRAVAMADGAGKWTGRLLLSPSIDGIIGELTERGFTRLGGYGAPHLGLVTGSNQFFAVRPSTANHYDLKAAQLERIVPPSRRRAAGRAFTEADWRAAAERDEQVYILRLHRRVDQSERVASLIQAGEGLGIQRAYKCAIRDPWYVLPRLVVPDLFVTYMNHHAPRIVTNGARAGCLNSWHAIILTVHRRLAAAALPLAALNSLTLLGAELGGRPYGGGVLKLEPREAADLPVPGPRVLAASWERIRPRASRLDRWLRAGRWEDVVEEIDGIVLRDVIGATNDQIDAVRQAAKLLRTRRLRRPSSRG